MINYWTGKVWKIMNHKLFDHTILRADADSASVKKVCDEAKNMDLCLSVLTDIIPDMLQSSWKEPASRCVRW